MQLKMETRLSSYSPGQHEREEIFSVPSSLYKQRNDAKGSPFAVIQEGKWSLPEACPGTCGLTGCAQMLVSRLVNSVNAYLPPSFNALVEHLLDSTLWHNVFT